MRPLQTPDIRVSPVDCIRLNRNLRDRISQSGYAIVEGRDFFIPLTLQQHWQDFAKSWNHLSEDVYLQHASFKRFRRYSYLRYDLFTREMTLLPNAPFYQSKLVNPLFGGIQRRFAPLLPASLQNPFLKQLIALDLEQFPIDYIQDSFTWKVGIHQIRIACENNQPAHPAPEGIHRDGHRFVAMHFIGKRNALGGMSNIYKEKCSLLESVNLHTAMDSIFVDDTCVMHDVTPIQPLKIDLRTDRDVLVLTYDFMNS
jgi:hypothetical protein